MSKFAFVLDMDVAAGTGKGVRKFQFTFYRYGNDYEAVKAALLHELKFPLIHAAFQVSNQIGRTVYFEQKDGLTENDYREMVETMQEERDQRRRQYDRVAAENEAKQKAKDTLVDSKKKS